MVGFFARFISDYSQMAEPLHALKRKGSKFVWGAEKETVLKILRNPCVKLLCCKSPILAGSTCCAPTLAT
jgi:hypothetical protein